MACRLCETPARVPHGPGRVYLWAPVDEIRRKLVDVVRGWPETMVPEDGSLVGTTDEFSGFLTRLLEASPWSEVERDGVTVLFLPLGRPLTFAATQETRSLGDWTTLGQAQFLTDLLERKALVTHFQPIVDARTGAPYGWECLTRGQEEDGTLVPPDRLFGTARQTGMTFPLDRLARLTALRNASRAQLGGQLFVNFIPTAIYDPAFCLRSTTELARELGIAPERVVFEVVESEEVTDAAHLRRIVAYYRDQGFRVALDDVGAGYSGLNALANLRPDVLKIDAGLVHGVDASPERQAVVRSLVTVGRDLGITVLAEGVETASELEWLVDTGVDLAQGYYFGRPQPR